MKMVRVMIATALTSTMIATSAFGTVEENSLSQQFQEVIDKNIPAEVVAPFNQALEQAGLEPVPASQPLETIYQSDSDDTFLDAVVAIVNGDTNAPPIPESPPLLLDSVVDLISPENTPPQSATNTFTPTVPSTYTATATASATLTLTATATSSLTASPTTSLTPTQTASFTPSSIPTIFLPSLTPSATKTKNPTATPTFTPTWTLTPTFTPNVPPTLIPTLPPGDPINFRFGIGGPYLITVAPGENFSIRYSYTISSDVCPSCITQIMTGISDGTHGGSCAFNGIPGLPPGVSGNENIVLTAPMTPGTYNVIVVVSWEYSCADALKNFPNGVLSEAISTINVVAP